MIAMNLPRITVENYPFANDRRTWLISIADMNQQPANVPQDKFERILFVHFDDLDHFHEPECTEEERPRFLNDETAAEMVAFINEAKEQQVDMIVNCHAGVCRSGAVVEVLKLAGWAIDSENQFSPERKPNMFVYNKLRLALGFKHSWE